MSWLLEDPGVQWLLGDPHRLILAVVALVILVGLFGLAAFHPYDD